MNLREIITENLKNTQMSRTDAAGYLGYKSVSGVTERLRSGRDMKFATAAKFLKLLGCHLVVRKDDGTEWEVDCDD